MKGDQSTYEMQELQLLSFLSSSFFSCSTSTQYPQSSPAQAATPRHQQSRSRSTRPHLNNGGTITVTGTGPQGQAGLSRSLFGKESAGVPLRCGRGQGNRQETVSSLPDPGNARILQDLHSEEPGGDARQDKKEGSKWSYSKALKDVGADIAYSVPAKIAIDKYQATLIGSIIGSRGTLLPAMDAKENAKRSMQLVKARFRSPDKVLAPRWKRRRTEPTRPRSRSARDWLRANIRSLRTPTRISRASRSPSRTRSSFPERLSGKCRDEPESLRPLLPDPGHRHLRRADGRGRRLHHEPALCLALASSAYRRRRNGHAHGPLLPGQRHLQLLQDQVHQLEAGRRHRPCHGGRRVHRSEADRDDHAGPVQVRLRLDPARPGRPHVLADHARAILKRTRRNRPS